jgi:hypothetical protein
MVNTGQGKGKRECGAAGGGGGPIVDGVVNPGVDFVDLFAVFFRIESDSFFILR